MTSQDYERLVRRLVHQSFDGITGVELLDISHNLKIMGLSGFTHQIDVCYKFRIWAIEFLVVVECKQYKGKVGVDDLLEFRSRIDDVRAHKGVFVTTVGFQRGAVAFAKANRIALLVARGTRERLICGYLTSRTLSEELDRELQCLTCALSLDLKAQHGKLTVDLAQGQLVAVNLDAVVTTGPAEISHVMIRRQPCNFHQSEMEQYFDTEGGVGINADRLLKLLIIEQLLTREPD